MTITDILRNLKNLIVSDELTYRKIFLGICKGNYLPINLRNQFRMMFGLEEIEIAKYFKLHVRQGYCCYDCGAAYGYYTLAFARLVQTGQIYAIETDSNLTDLLKQTLSYNIRKNCETKIEVLNFFISDSINHATNEITLDHLVFECNLTPPDFIKLDIEGAEYKALLGAINVIKQYTPKFIIEVHSQELENYCKDILMELGYSVLIINQSKIIPETRTLPHNRWLYAEYKN